MKTYLSEERKKELEKIPLLIGIPHNQEKEDKRFRLGLDLVKTYIGGCWKSLPDDMHFTDSCEWAIKWESDFVHGQIDDGRNVLAYNATQAGFEYICMIDSDMGNFPPNFFHLLLDSAVRNKADIMGALCYSRHGREGIPQYVPAVLHKYIDGNYYAYESIEHFKGVISGDYLVGTGCIIIKTDVFKNLDMPYFLHQKDYSEKGKIKETGEDIYFCKKARDKGYKIHVNTDLLISHYGYVPLPFEYFNQLSPYTLQQRNKVVIK